MSNIYKMDSVAAMTSLVKALEEIQTNYKSNLLNAKLGNDHVNEYKAEGAVVAIGAVIGAIEDTVTAAIAQRIEDQKNRHPQDKEYLREMAKLVQSKLPDNFGFLLLAAPFGDVKGRLLYTSTMERAGAINLLKEFMLKSGDAEDWMKHI